MLTPLPILATAPMVDWTDRHCLHLFRLLAPKAELYTEMMVDKAIIHGNPLSVLRWRTPAWEEAFSISLAPLTLQLGGSNPVTMAAAVAKADATRQFTDYNINVGCPSDRVKAGAFGACLMAEPATVAACYSAMAAETDKPISIKTRLGIKEGDQNFDSQEFLYRFIETTASAGCQRYTLHARKAILGGLSPKQNREIPPLQYERVYQLKRDFPDLHITINGGIKTLEDAQQHLQHVDAVMLGRLAYQTPYALAEIASTLFDTPLPCREDVVRKYLQYVELALLEERPTTVHTMLKPLIGLFQGVQQAKQWRQRVSQYRHIEDSVTEDVLGMVPIKVS